MSAGIRSAILSSEGASTEKPGIERPPSVEPSSRTRITKQLIAFVAVCLCALAITAAAGLMMAGHGESEAILRSEVVALNDMAQTAASPTEAQAIAQAQDALRRGASVRETASRSAVLLLFIVASGCLIALSVYLYRSVVRPFAKLQGFAEEVASGNLDLPLEYERSNPFGRFAWAFDHMRSELKRARANEVAAIERNKTVIASLAHDLRTPIASIRTYSEALGMGLDCTEAERREYAEVIERKCVEVSQLVDDMLTHSLAELDRISVECSAVSAAPLLRQVVSESGSVEASVPRADAAIIHADELRLRQAIENVLVNASKYASGSQVDVSGTVLDGDRYRIAIRDFGPGMAPEDIPFAFDRFYRASSVKDVPGSGLGLFVVKHVVERMGGCVVLENARPGLTVLIDVPLEGKRAS